MLLPESMAAVRAALRNRMQTSLNLALGSALATIGLTIPAVAALSIGLGLQLELGLTGKETILALTLVVSTLTFAGGSATVLQGAVHLVLFAAFLFLAVVPILVQACAAPLVEDAHSSRGSTGLTRCRSKPASRDFLAVGVLPPAGDGDDAQALAAFHRAAAAPPRSRRALACRCRAARCSGGTRARRAAPSPRRARPGFRARGT